MPEPSNSKSRIHSASGAEPYSFMFSGLKRLFPLMILLWFFVHLVILGRATLPLEAPYKGKWPWGMFRNASAENRTLVAEGKNKNGPWKAIPLEEFFHYNRGQTALYIYDHAKAFRRNGDKGERKQFAEYLAQQMDNRGVAVTEIRFFWKKVHFETGKTRRESRGRFQIRARP
jgi:hypothetical protein